MVKDVFGFLNIWPVKSANLSSSMNLDLYSGDNYIKKIIEGGVFLKAGIKYNSTEFSIFREQLQSIHFDGGNLSYKINDDYSVKLSREHSKEIREIRCYITTSCGSKIELNNTHNTISLEFKLK